MKHRISQTDGADDHEVNEPEIPVKSAEGKKYPAYGRQSISRLMRIVAPIPKNPASKAKFAKKQKKNCVAILHPL